MADGWGCLPKIQNIFVTTCHHKKMKQNIPRIILLQINGMTSFWVICDDRLIICRRKYQLVLTKTQNLLPPFSSLVSLSNLCFSLLLSLPCFFSPIFIATVAPSLSHRHAQVGSLSLSLSSLLFYFFSHFGFVFYLFVFCIIISFYLFIFIFFMFWIWLFFLFVLRFLCNLIFVFCVFFFFLGVLWIFFKTTPFFGFSVDWVIVWAKGFLALSIGFCFSSL